MSLPSTNPRIVYIGNNSTGTYPWTWLVYQAADLRVAVLSTDSPPVLTDLTLGTDYNIQNPNLQLNNSNGGSIVLTSSGFFAFNNGILPAGYALTIRRAVTFQQSTQLTSQGLYDPASIEGALDFLAMQTIQLQDALNHVIQLPIDDTAIPAQKIPIASLRANTFAAFDGNGDVIASPGGVTLIANTFGAEIFQGATAIGAAVATAATVPEAQIALGLPTTVYQATSTITGPNQNYTLIQNIGFVPPPGFTMIFLCPATLTANEATIVNGSYANWGIGSKDGGSLSTSPASLVVGNYYLLAVAVTGDSWVIVA